MDGYVFLWRKSIDSAVFQNAELWKLWCWCLMKATFKRRSVSVKTGRGETIVELEPGQFIWGRLSCAEFFKWPASTAKKRMEKLQSLGNISLKSDTHYSIVTICNWEEYQQGEDDKGTTKEQPSDNQVTTKEHKQERKEGKERKEETYTPPRFDARVYLLDAGADPSLASDWFKARGKKKAANTETAMKGFLREVYKSEMTINEVLTLCCEKSWQGFKAEWVKQETMEIPEL